MAVSKRLRFEVLRRDDHTCQYCGRSAPDVELQVDHVVPVTLGGRDEPSNLRTACRACNSGKSSIPSGAPRVEQVPFSRDRMAAALQEAYAETVRRPGRAKQLEEDIRNTWYDELGVQERGVVGPSCGYTWGPDKLPWAVVTEWDDNGDPVRGHPFATEAEAYGWFDEQVERDTPPLPDDLDDAAARWWDAGLEHLPSATMWYFVRDCILIAKKKRGDIPDSAMFSYFAGVMWNRVRDLQARAEARLQAEDDAEAQRGRP